MLDTDEIVIGMGNWGRGGSVLGDNKVCRKMAQKWSTQGAKVGSPSPIQTLLEITDRSIRISIDNGLEIVVDEGDGGNLVVVLVPQVGLGSIWDTLTPSLPLRP